MAKPLKIEAYARLVIHWDGDPTEDDLKPEEIYRLLRLQLDTAPVIRTETTRYVHQKKSATKLTPQQKAPKAVQKNK